ncbi:hypothetical protein HNQ77_003020 [Silvibacterium bohemicum]|uniref:Toxin-antitoxin system, antitoxin component, Xre family protein n=1 Tax=Silvibacterium bohemicum TaxID=1577686 RepID=A0A841K478_9BACT|nr:hypothetical protein [Silvibacterium bohemicum]MBB6145064.1 hypothetical protein [Silvibacterium bohemicum]
MSQSQRNLAEEIETLSSDERAEVERFLDTLMFRNQERVTARIATSVSEPAFEKIWSNPEDDIYDAL